MDPKRPDSAGAGAERWSRLEPLLDAWIDADDEAARAALLETVQERDPDLLPEFEEMVRQISAEADALDRPLADAACELLRGMAAAAEATRESTRRGQILGPYRLLEVLDRGGMGVVYVAERADEQFEKRVAVKLLPAGLESRETERRFLTERQILANLEHPNIARLLDGGVTDEGYPYLVMELVEGMPVDKHCARHELALKPRIELFLQVCAAVQYAHQHMVAHRDLKPSNILVTPAGDVKLLDFGIAKLEDPAFAADGDTTVFQPRSLRYASPEQVANRPVSAASDVYSLGVVLYELLTDRPPFDLAGLSPTEVEATVRERPPEPPSRRATRWAPRLAGDLDNIVLKALRKDPERRYGSAADLGQDLRRYLEGMPVRARPSTRRYRVAKFVGRHRLGAVVATAVLVLTVVGVVAIARQSRVAAIERDRAERAADFVLEFMTIPDPDRGGGTTITSRELLDQVRIRASSELAGQPDMQIRILGVLAEGYANLAVFDLAAEIQRELIALLQPTGDRARLAQAHRELGSALANDLQGEEAIEHLEIALDLQRHELGPAGVEVATTLGALARAIAGGLPPGHPESERTEPLLQEAIGIHRNLGNHDSVELAAHLHLLGQVYFGKALADPDNRERHVEVGESAMRESLAMRRRIHGEKGFPVAQTLNDLGLGIDAVGRPDEAMVLLQEALEIHQQALGREHPNSLHMLNNVAAMHRDAGRYEKAEPLYRECLEQWKKIEPEGSAQMWAPMYGLGRVLFGMGRLDEAEEQFARLLAVIGEDSDNLRAHIARGMQGEIQLRRGRHEKAEALLLASHEALARYLAHAHPENVRARARLVALYESWGQPGEADRYR